MLVGRRMVTIQEELLAYGYNAGVDNMQDVVNGRIAASDGITS